MKRYVLIVPDGAADLYRDHEGRSPLALARAPYLDRLASWGVSGRMQTLFSSLPRGSLVANLGLLGWDPRDYCPHGRASAELLATHRIRLDKGDLAFRVNLVRIEDLLLASYNADYIKSNRAARMIDMLNLELGRQYPELELYHCSDFRSVLVARRAGVCAKDLVCIEPHENVGRRIQIESLVQGRNPKSRKLARRINGYLARAAALLAPEAPYAIFPWSASEAFQLPSFSSNTGFHDPIGIVGAMDFLHGIAIAGEMDFFAVGNGRPDTDFAAKGARVIELLEADYGLVLCHVNAPDEASHMGDLDLKIETLEAIDELVVGPVVEYFLRNREELGGIAVLPDHHTNVFTRAQGERRVKAHSLDPVPFVLWNGAQKDPVDRFDEDSARRGMYAQASLTSLDLMELLMRSTVRGDRMAGSIPFVPEDVRQGHGDPSLR